MGGAPESPPLTPDEPHTASPEDGRTYERDQVLDKINEAVNEWFRHNDAGDKHNNSGRPHRAQARWGKAATEWNIADEWRAVRDRFFRRPTSSLGSSSSSD